MQRRGANAAKMRGNIMDEPTRSRRLGWAGLAAGMGGTRRLGHDSAIRPASYPVALGGERSEKRAKRPRAGHGYFIVRVFAVSGAYE